jgi:hypothetical protein
MSKAVTVIEALDLGFGKATGFIVMLHRCL